MKHPRALLTGRSVLLFWLLRGIFTLFVAAAVLARVSRSAVTGGLLGAWGGGGSRRAGYTFSCAFAFDSQCTSLVPVFISLICFHLYHLALSLVRKVFIFLNFYVFIYPGSWLLGGLSLVVWALLSGSWR